MPANKVVREFVIKVNADGQVVALDNFEKLDKKLNKTAESAGKVDRTMKGTANATNNATSAFAKQAQGLGGIVRIYATIAANVFALSSAFQILKRSADLEILKKSSEQLSISTGQNFNAIGESLRKITGGALAYKEAMQAANLALSGGLSGTQARQITEIATKAANALGRSVPEAVTRLTQAIVKAEPELADEFGIVLRVTEAVRDYAKELGKLPTELTTVQKQQAIFNQFLEQGNEKFSQVTIQTNPYDKLVSTFLDLTHTITEFIRVPLDPFIRLLSEGGLALGAVFAAMAGGLATLLLPEMKKFGAKLKELGAIAGAKSFDKYKDSLQQVGLLQNELTKNFDDYTDTVKSGLKGVNLSNLDFGFKAFNAALVQELADPDVLGKELQDNILKNAFDGDRGRMKSSIKSFITGLNKEISKAGRTGNVEFKGFSGGVRDATNLVNLLESTLANTFKQGFLGVTNFNGVLDVTKVKVQTLIAQIKLFGATLKTISTQNYAAGLEGGFLNALTSIRDTFAQSGQLAGGFGKTIAGVFGVGSKLAGGFLSSILNMVSAFSLWGLAITAVLSVIEPIGKFLGITSDEAGKAEEAIDKYSESVELSKRQLEDFEKIGNDTFSDQITSATRAINLINTFTDNINELGKAFGDLEKASDDFWSKLFGQEGEIKDVLSGFSNEFNNLLKTAPKDLREQFKKEGNIAVDVTTEFLPNKRFFSVGGQDPFIQLAKVADKHPFLELVGDKLLLKYNIASEDETLTKVAELLDDTANSSNKLLTKVEEKVNAATKALGDGIKVGASAAKDLSNTLTDLAKQYSEEAIKIANASQEYATVTRALTSANTALKERRITPDQLVGKNFPEEVSKAVKSVLSLKDETQLTFSQVKEGLESIQKAELQAAQAKTLSAKRSAELNAALVKQNDLAKRGSVGAITRQYDLQRGLLEQQKVLLVQNNRELDKKISRVKGDINAQAQIVSFETQRKANNAKIAELTAKQNTQFSRNKALIEQSKVVRRSQLTIENNIAKTLEDQSSVLKAIVASTGNISVRRELLEIESQIALQKQNQLKATIAVKKTELSDAAGPKVAAIQSEIDVLKRKMVIEEKIASIKLIQSQIKIDLDVLNRENAARETALELERKALEFTKEKLDIQANNKFSKLEDRRLAELLSRQQDINIQLLEQKSIQNEILNLQNKITVEQQKLTRIALETNTPYEESTQLIQLQLELQETQVSQLQNINELESARLELKEKQFEIDSKNANLFNDSRKFSQLLSESFRRAAEDFADRIGNTIDRITTSTLNVVDRGVDAFVAAVKNGENVLTATKDAILNTIRDEILTAAAENIKAAIRSGLSRLSDIGPKKNPELLVQQQQLISLKNIEGILQAQGTKSAISKTAETSVDVIASLGKDLLGSPKGVQQDLAINKMSDSILKNATTISTTIENTANESDSLFSSLFSGLQSSFSSIFGSLFGGESGIGAALGDTFGQLASTAINLFLAKGGLTGPIMNRVPMHANGTITDGPELAVIGEGPKREAVVPLPDNRSIPVTIHGETEKPDNVVNNYNISIDNMNANGDSARKTANQLALQLARRQEVAKGRIG